MTNKLVHDDARRQFASFAATSSAPKYLAIEAALYRTWHRLNSAYFRGYKFVEPHILCARTSSKTLAHCRRLTPWGGTMAIVLNERLLIDPINREWVINTWPSPGMARFVDDLLLKCLVRQFILETNEEDDTYDGFGPLFAAEAKRIGESEGLPEVIERNRPKQVEMHLCKYWPHNVRPEGYYGDDVSERLLDLAAGRHESSPRRTPPPSLGLLELLLSRLNILDQKRAVERTRELLIRHIDRLQSQRERPVKPKRQVELGGLDVDGVTRLGEIRIDPAWLAANNGIARKVAEAIHHWRAFGELPILADALEDAGCGGTEEENAILRHLRANIEHTRSCWVLRAIREADQQEQ